MNDLPNFTPQTRVLILAAHPDDETLATGGLIQRARSAGAAVRVLFVTSGDNNPWPQRALERRWRIGPCQRVAWARRRREEALAALNCLGLAAEDAAFLGFPDLGLTQLLLTQTAEWAAALASHILPWRPTLIVVPSASDRHPDHSALAVVMELIRARRPADQPAWQTIAYRVHGLDTGPGAASSEHHDGLDLTAAEIEGKRRALLCHRSQLVLSRRRFLGYVRPTESFESDTGQVACQENQPIGFARQQGEDYAMKIGIRRWWPASRRVLLIRQGADVGQTLQIDLPCPSRRGAEAAIRDPATGALVGQAFCKRHGKGLAVRMPARLLAGADRLYAKLEERGLFFDRAGWRPIPPPAASAGGPPLSHAAGHSSAADARVTAIIPCYNVAATCEAVIRDTAHRVDRLIVVDDGSNDGTGAILTRLAAELGDAMTLLRFPLNRGKGVALLEAFRCATQQESGDVLVTIDADGQHRPADIPALVRCCLQQEADLVIGSRLNSDAMPVRSRLGNAAARRLLRAFYPDCPVDTQSGLRAHRAAFVRQIVARLQGRRYETEMRILLLALREGLKVRPVAIPTVYRDGNRGSHFRPTRDSLRILWTIMTARFTP